MATYLWWPYPSELGFDALNGMAPAFGVMATVDRGVLVPHPSYGIVFKIELDLPDVSDGLVQLAPGAAGAVATAMTDFDTITLGNDDSVYIVGHCSMGIQALVGEFASVPVVASQQAAIAERSRNTAFEIPSQQDITLSQFLKDVREFSKPFLPKKPDGTLDFTYQVFFNEGIVRVYSPVPIVHRPTTIANGKPTHTNAERKFVIRDQHDPYTDTDKNKSDFYRAAGKLAQGFCTVFSPAEGCTGKAILWACYSARQDQGQKSIAAVFREHMRDIHRKAAIRVFGCTGKASTGAKQVAPNTRAVLRVRDTSDDPWLQMGIGANVQQIR